MSKQETTRTGEQTLGRPCGRLRDDDSGFALLEVMIALSLITVIMSAVSAQYVSGVLVSTTQDSTSKAAQLASSAIADLRALDPSDLLTGRREADVRAQRLALLAVPQVRDKPWLEPDDGKAEARLAWSNRAGTAVVSTSARRVDTDSRVARTNGRGVFRVHTYLECRDPAVVSMDTLERSCATSKDQNLIRGVVAVVWKDSRHCPRGGCAFVTETLIDAHGNPTFDLNEPLPPAPVIDDPGVQELLTDTDYSRQLKVLPTKGVGPFTWALKSGALPPGLTLSADGTGLLAGRTGTLAGTYASTIIVTDAFLRTDEVSIVWKVIEPLRLDAVVSQGSFTDTAIIPLQLGARGGSGTYAYSQQGLPPGLSLDPARGRVTGTPTTAGVYAVTVTVTDGNRRASISFAWTVDYPPLVPTSPGNQVSTTGQALDPTVVIRVTGGSKSYSFAQQGLPAGLRLDASTGRITGAPSALSDSTVTVTVTDKDPKVGSKSITFAWKVVAEPTVTTPGAQSTVTGSTVDLPITSTCSNGPCAFTVTGLPSGLDYSATTGRITGTVAAAAKSSPSVTVTIEDVSGATASTSFAWAVPMKWTAPGNRTTRPNTAVTVDMSDFVSGGLGSYTFGAQNLPSWLSLNTRTGVVTGTSPAANSRTTNIRITARDAGGTSQPSPAFQWNVSNLNVSIADSNITRSQNVSSPLSSFTSGGNTPYTWTVSNLPPGLGVSNNAITGRATSTGTWTVSVTVSDNVGATANDTFILRVTS